MGAQVERLKVSYKDKEKMREYQRVWIQKRRDAFFSGKSCATCNSRKDLELDHVDPETKSYNPSQLWGMSDSNPKKIAELAKCQVLCYDCHKKKTATYLRDSGMTVTKECPHGHNLDLVGSRTHAYTTVGTKVSCNYCKYLGNHSRNETARPAMTLEEYVAKRKTK